MSLPLQDQANILHGMRGGWTMIYEIINALLIREVSTQTSKDDNGEMDRLRGGGLFDPKR